MARRGSFGLQSLSLFVPLAFAASSASAEGPLEVGAGFGASRYNQVAEFGQAVFDLRTIRPYARYDGPAGHWDVNAFAQSRLDFYSGSAVDTLDTRQYANSRIQGRLARRWSAYEDLRLDGGFLHTHDLFESDLGTVLPKGTLTRWNGAFGSHYDLYETDLRSRVTLYSDPALSDGLAFGGYARFVPLRREIDAAFAGVAYSQLDVGDHTALENRSVSVGYRRKVVPLLQAELEVGGIDTRFDDGGRQQLPMVGLGLARDPDRGGALAFELRARFEGDSLAAVSGEGSYHVASGRLSLRAESSADAEGGFYRSATRTRRFAAELEDTLARANIIGITSSYTTTQALRHEQKGTEVLRATGWAMRRVQPWLNLRVAASFMREPVAFHPNEPVYRRVRLDAELVVLSRDFGVGMFKALTGIGSGEAQ
jgi:hypothetical protein